MVVLEEGAVDGALAEDEMTTHKREDFDKDIESDKMDDLSLKDQRKLRPVSCSKAAAPPPLEGPPASSMASTSGTSGSLEKGCASCWPFWFGVGKCTSMAPSGLLISIPLPR